MKMSRSSAANPLPDAKNTIEAWQLEGILIEYYHYPPGLARPLPRHCHHEYQVGFSTDTNGGYVCRGSTHLVPQGHFSIVHPGEVHTTTRQSTWIEQHRTFWMLFIPPERLGEIPWAPYSGPANLPFFPNPVVRDRPLADRFLAFFQGLRGQASHLEQTERLSACLCELVRCHADREILPATIGRDRRRVDRVRAYIEARPADRLSLDDLAQLVGLSSYRLHHIFRQEVGMALHQYQIQARIARAKQLLHLGLPLKQVAEDTGFSDQSHLTRHFKRFVQVTPGRYLPQR